MKIRVKCVDRTASDRYSFLASKKIFTVIGFTRLKTGKIGFTVEGDPDGSGFLTKRFAPIEEIGEVIITIPDDLKYMNL